MIRAKESYLYFQRKQDGNIREDIPSNMITRVRTYPFRVRTLDNRANTHAIVSLSTYQYPTPIYQLNMLRGVGQANQS